MSTVFSFDVLLKWARRNDAVCIFESTKIPEIGGRGRRVSLAARSEVSFHWLDCGDRTRILNLESWHRERNEHYW